MSDLERLYAAIIASPDEDTPRLMYADELDERQHDHYSYATRAEFIRAQIFGDTERARVIMLERGRYYLSGSSPKDWVFPTIHPDSPIVIAPGQTDFVRGFVGTIYAATVNWQHICRDFCARFPVQHVDFLDWSSRTGEASRSILPQIKSVYFPVGDYGEPMHEYEAYALWQHSRDWFDTLESLTIGDATDRATEFILKSFPNQEIRIRGRSWSKAITTSGRLETAGS